MGHFKWLHLSDLHFRLRAGFELDPLTFRLPKSPSYGTVIKEKRGNTRGDDKRESRACLWMRAGTGSKMGREKSTSEN